MSELFVILRDKISRQAQEYSPEEAQRWLDHPVFGERLEVVRTAKPEVLKKKKADEDEEVHDTRSDTSEPDKDVK